MATEAEKVKNNPGQASDDPTINKFDQKDYTQAINSDVDMYNKAERELYHKNAEIEWKGLCHEQGNGECCFLLGEYYRTSWAAGPLGKYSPMQSFKTFSDCCGTLNWASCCSEAGKNFLYNSSLRKNFFTQKRNFLYAFDHLRRACLEQGYETVGGERPTDFKAMDEAGKACNTLHTIISNVRSTGKFHLTIPPERLTFSKEELFTQMAEEARPENLIKNCKVKPDYAKTLHMFETLPLSVLISQGCKFRSPDLCFKLFQARVNGSNGFSKNMDEAYEVGEKACRRNHPKACFNLWKMYERGIGGPPNPYKADVWKNWYYEVSGKNAQKTRFKANVNDRQRMVENPNVVSADECKIKQ